MSRPAAAETGSRRRGCTLQRNNIYIWLSNNYFPYDYYKERADYRLERVWRSTHLSWWMTSMLHIAPDQDQAESALQLAQLRRHLVSSRTAATMLAETYAGYAPLRYDPATRKGGHCRLRRHSSHEPGACNNRPL